jgi:hypothetical protein
MGTSGLAVPIAPLAASLVLAARPWLAAASSQAPAAGDPPEPAAGPPATSRAAEAPRDFDYEWRVADEFGLPLTLEPGGGMFVHAGGRFALDFNVYDQRNAKDNGLFLQIVRPLVEGRWRETTFRAELDAVGVDSKRHSFDFWVGQDLSGGMKLEVGQIRVAMASEYATREENLPLVGFGFTSYLTGRYDLGVRGEAGLFDDAIGLEAVAAAGEGFGLEGEGKEDPMFLSRATLQPFRNSGPAALQGLYFGFAAAYQPEFNDEIRIATPLQSVVFVTNGDLDGDRAAWGAIEAGWHYGPFRLGFEGTRGIVDNVEVPGGGVKDIDELFSWNAYASIFLTGERPAWKRGRWRMPQWGPESIPLELSARYSNADIDRDLFDVGLASYNPSTQEVRTFSLNLAWYPEAGTRVALGWVRTIADHELDTFGFANRDSSFVLRLEVDL